MGRPIIGITGELEAARWGNWIREAVVSPVSYTRAVERAGGTPVILPPVPAGSVPVLIAGLNGLVLTGGRDIDPSLYDEAPHDQTDIPDHRRVMRKKKRFVNVDRRGGHHMLDVDALVHRHDIRFGYTVGDQHRADCVRGGNEAVDLPMFPS